MKLWLGGGNAIVSNVIHGKHNMGTYVRYDLHHAYSNYVQYTESL